MEQSKNPHSNCFSTWERTVTPRLWHVLPNDNILELVYKEKSVVKTLSFQVKLKRKGYLEMLSVNKKIQIPPFFPLLYSKVDFNRIRVGFTANGELIVDNKWEKSGRVFIFMGGAGGRMQYFFKSLNNNK